MEVDERVRELVVEGGRLRDEAREAERDPLDRFRDDPAGCDRTCLAARGEGVEEARVTAKRAVVELVPEIGHLGPQTRWLFEKREKPVVTDLEIHARHERRAERRRRAARVGLLLVREGAVADARDERREDREAVVEVRVDGGTGPSRVAPSVFRPPGRKRLKP